MKKVGRNDACPCGSGKKYKHCCLTADQSAGIIRLVPEPEDKQASVTDPKVIDTLLENAPWFNEQYKEVAEDLVRQMKGSYELDLIEEAVKLWFAYSGKEQPQIRKAGVMQAAVEYTIATLHGLTEVTQSRLSEKYDVSPGTISQRAQKMLEMANLPDAPRLEDEGPDPLSVERAVRNLTKELETGKFETIQEAQAYFSKLLHGDKDEK